MNKRLFSAGLAWFSLFTVSHLFAMPSPLSVPPDTLARLPFELNFNHLYVQVQVGTGVPLWFLLDTGAQATMIDQGAAERVGLAFQEVHGAAAGAGEATIPLYRASDVTLQVGTAQLALAQLYVLPLSDILAPHEGRRVDGLLGYDFMERYVVEVDHVAREIVLLDPATYSHAGEGLAVPLTLKNNHPHVEAALTLPEGATVTGDFLIDTGAIGTVYLATPFVDAHGLLGRGIRTRPGLVAGIGGITEQRVGRVAQLRFGAVTVDEPLTYFSQEANGGFAGLIEADGVIGTEILRRYTVTWDYSRQRVWLAPNPHLGEPDEHALAHLTGLHLMARDAAFEHLEIAYILPGSPAAASGLQEGDRLLALDGVPVETVTLEVLRRRLLQEGPRVFQVQRGTAVWEETLTLRRSW